MSVLEHKEFRDHEQVVFCFDNSVGLRTIIAIHSTVLGPSLGGTRMWMYKTHDEALNDVLRLSRGMTYKAAVAGLKLGGGKAVIIADPNRDKSEALFRAYGRYVETLGGRYITAEDVGTSVADMQIVRKETKHVTGIDRAMGGGGDPSPLTALGVYYGIKACMKKATGSDSLKGKTMAVQGAGHVASYLCEYLAKEDAKIVVTDIFEEKAHEVVKKTGATYIAPEKIYDVDADVFCPCALGAIVNDETVPRLKAMIIAGGANNQLANEARHGQALREKGILYAPDYVINAGGLINVYSEINGYDREDTVRQVQKIYDTLLHVFKTAERERIPTYEASNRIAEERLAQASYTASSSPAAIVAGPAN